MRYIIYVLFFLANVALASQVLVIVDGKPITSVDLNKRIEALRIVNPSLEITPSLNSALLNNLVSEELFRNEAKRLKVSVTQEEVKEHFKALQLDYGLPNEILEKLRKNQSFYQQAESQVLWNKLIGLVLYSKVKVSDAEVRDEQKVRKAEIREVSFKQIILADPDHNKIELLRKEANNCSKLNPMAMQLGFSSPHQTSTMFSDLNSELQNVISSLQENTLSDVVTINNQKQLIMVCSKKIINNPDDVKLIRQELSNRKINAEAQKYLAELKKRIYVEYTESSLKNGKN